MHNKASDNVVTAEIKKQLIILLLSYVIQCGDVAAGITKQQRCSCRDSKAANNIVAVIIERYDLAADIIKQLTTF